MRHHVCVWVHGEEVAGRQQPLGKRAASRRGQARWAAVSALGPDLGGRGPAVGTGGELGGRPDRSPKGLSAKRALRAVVSHYPGGRAGWEQTLVSWGGGYRVMTKSLEVC